MKEYQDLLTNVLENGSPVDDRTGVGTIAIFGEQIKFDLRKGFPIITTKKINFPSVVSELLWFLKGSTNVNELRALRHGEDKRENWDYKTIWDDNFSHQGVKLGYKDGYLGPIYGKQWRDFNQLGIDQIRYVIDEAKENPSSRRLLVSAWNPLQINDMALPPCHYGFQINVDGEYIDLLWTQRSVDICTGLPFNITSYAILLSIFARILDKTPRYLTGQLGNVHIYKNHIENAKIQIERTPFSIENTTLHISPKLKTLEDFENAKVEDFIIINYRHHPFLKFPMAV
jgi:thymidylate synthase